MRPEARFVQDHCMQVIEDAPCSPRLRDFLLFGEHQSANDANTQVRSTAWHGVSHLKSMIASGYDGIEANNVYLASRTKSLMQFGAHLMFRMARRALCVDLNWNGYQQVLDQTALDSGTDTVVLPFRQKILDGQIDIDEICNQIVSVYKRYRCDCLFLPYVDSFGIRFPVRRIVELLRQESVVRFTIVDAAQSFGHIDTMELAGIADWLIGGTHKWIGSYQPLGVGIACSERSQRSIANRLENAVKSRTLDDSLLRFLLELEQGREFCSPETVNLCPVFAGAGAMQGTPSASVTLPTRIANSESVSKIAESHSWKRINASKQFSTGIVLLRSNLKVRCAVPAASVEVAFADMGISLTGYADGLIRLAMPETLLTGQEFEQLEKSFERVCYRLERQISTVKFSEPRNALRPIALSRQASPDTIQAPNSN